MLFIVPECLGEGIGGALLNHAIKDMGAVRVDVNEQNPKALGFYQHAGFMIVGRSEVDGMGKPFPLLHMTLESSLV